VPHITQSITQAGPQLDLFVSPSEPRIKALLAAGKQLPALVKIRGLVDTGASGACIDLGCLVALDLSPTGRVAILTPSTGGQAHNCNQYDIQLLIPHPNGNYLRIPSLPIIESNLKAPQGIDALIGRDVLSRCLFVYDGGANIFSLAF